MQKETRETVQDEVRKAMSYSTYRELIGRLLSEDKTTGPNQSEALTHYTKMNDHRMSRWDKRVELLPELKSALENLSGNYIWLVVTEGWCGDAAQNLPAIHKMAELNPMISLRIVLRDQNLELMNEYLTNGGQSIPKLIQTQDNEVTGTWGPRPTVATNMVQEYKEKHGSVDAEFKKELQLWYNKDKNESLFSDFLSFPVK